MKKLLLITIAIFVGVNYISVSSNKHHYINNYNVPDSLDYSLSNNDIKLYKETYNNLTDSLNYYKILYDIEIQKYKDDSLNYIIARIEYIERYESMYLVDSTKYKELQNLKTYVINNCPYNHSIVKDSIDKLNSDINNMYNKIKIYEVGKPTLPYKSFTMVKNNIEKYEELLERSLVNRGILKYNIVLRDDVKYIRIYQNRSNGYNHIDNNDDLYFKISDINIILNSIVSLENEKWQFDTNFLRWVESHDDVFTYKYYGPLMTIREANDTSLDKGHFKINNIERFKELLISVQNQSKTVFVK